MQENQKDQTKAASKLEAQHKKASAQKEKAEAKVNALQQKAGDKGVPAAKLKPLQKALNSAQSEGETLEQALNQAKAALHSVQQEVEVLQYIKEAVSKLENHHSKASASKNKKAGRGE